MYKLQTSHAKMMHDTGASSSVRYSDEHKLKFLWRSIEETLGRVLVGCMEHLVIAQLRMRRWLLLLVSPWLGTTCLVVLS